MGNAAASVPYKGFGILSQLPALGRGEPMLAIVPFHIQLVEVSL
jgi:hypothetical protein